jgi:probable HAF family extracellular repeat protein
MLTIPNRILPRRSDWMCSGLVVLAGVIGMGGMGGVAVGQTITAIPLLPGGTITRATGVSASGTAASAWGDNAAGQDVAIRWTLAGGSANLGLLTGGAINSYAEGIDATGTILAAYGDSFGPTRAARWTTGGGYQILPVVAGTNTFGTAAGISDSGAVVVGTSGTGGLARAFRWDSAAPGTSTNLGVLPLQSSSGAMAVSGNGAVVVGASGNRAFRWTSAGGMVDLGSLPGQVWAMGEGVNTDGSVIVGRFNNGLGEFGFRWTSAGGMVNLGQTPAGCLALRPRAVSGDGTVVVGQVSDNASGLTGFIWTPSLGARVIGPHLTSRAVNLAGWTITDVTGISADGTAMCGNGIFAGQPLGWVVRNLPCPAFNSPIGVIGDNGCVGGMAVLGVNWSMQVGALSSVTFRWFRNGVQIADGPQPSGSTISGSTGATITISNMQIGDAGSYVVAISAAGACETFSAPLTLQGPAQLALNINPVSGSACAGANPSFFAVPSAPSIPPSSVTYRWQKLVTPPNGWADIFDGPSGNGGSFVGTGTSTFSILNAQAGDAARYRCVFGVLGCGPASTLVTPSAVLSITPNTSIVTNPSNISVCSGDNDAEFTVVSSPAGPGVTYQWQKLTMPPNVYSNISDGPTGNGGFYGGTQTPTLAIGGLYAGDYTRYRCVVTGPCGGSVISANALLSLPPEATITAGPTPTGPGGGCAGGSAGLSVTATPPGSAFQWQRYVGPCINCWQNIGDGPTGNGGVWSGTQTPMLTLSGLNPIDAGAEYRCIVTGPCGITPAVSAGASMTVLATPVIQTQPLGGAACSVGSRTVSVALAPGNFGTVSYQWWRFVPAQLMFAPVPGGPLPSGAIASGATSPSLTIAGFTPQDTGQYYCAVTGSCGTTLSTVVTLTYCVPDFNCNGVVNIDDIFIYLNAWFAGNPACDVSGNDIVNIDDIFIFLNLWFAGC